MEKKIFHHPFTMVLSGSTGSGKTEWLMKFLNNLDILIDSNNCMANGNKEKDKKERHCQNRPEHPIKSIIYCYGEVNEKILSLKKREHTQEHVADAIDKKYVPIRLMQGVPSEELIEEEANRSGKRLLLILDDLMTSLKSSTLDNIFALGSHNWGVSVILVTQHLFSKDIRMARNNAHYIVLMRNPAGALQVRNLATQLFPMNFKYFMEAHDDSMKSPFSYIVIDMHPTAEDHQRLKTHIYPDEGWTVVYVPKTLKIYA